jgi:hypothetical protein
VRRLRAWHGTLGTTESRALALLHDRDAYAVEVRARQERTVYPVLALPVELEMRRPLTTTEALRQLAQRTASPQ